MVGHLLAAVIRGAFGAGAWTLPILLGLLAWRLLRHPDRNSETARVVIGWAALIIGALGLVNIANGTPQPADGAAVLRGAGGLIGFFASAPLVAAVTPWAAAPRCTGCRAGSLSCMASCAAAARPAATGSPAMRRAGLLAVSCRGAAASATRPWSQERTTDRTTAPCSAERCPAARLSPGKAATRPHRPSPRIPPQPRNRCPRHCCSARLPARPGRPAGPPGAPERLMPRGTTPGSDPPTSRRTTRP